MSLVNARFGFATNSSSSHSLLFFPESYGPVPRNNVDGSMQFGWEDFVLSSTGPKLEYLYLLLGYAMRNVPDASTVISRLLWGTDSPPIWEDTADNHYIDHQSLVVFPTKFNSSEISMEFLEDLVTWVKHQRTVILGGNDNSDGNPLGDPRYV
jgi:hypothetical protein